MSEAIATIVSAYELPRTPAGGHQLRARFQGVRSVRATRKPMMKPLEPAGFALRYAERRLPGPVIQEPPRRTRRLQSRLVQAEPSVGAPL